MKTILLSIAFALSFLGLAGCSSVTQEKTVRTQTVISEEPVIGQPAPSAR